MTVLSIRFKRLGVYERLKRGAAQRAESLSSAGERLIDEGLRMDAYPGIVFRDGPAGRRAALDTGPDVWQVVPLLQGLEGSLEERIAETAEQLWLTERQVRAVSRYYAEFTDEIDTMIAENDEAAAREYAAWKNERKLLTGVKLLLDEMYAPSVAALLRDWGHDAIAVKERADLVGMSDENLVQAATAESRVVVTEDVRDFAVLGRRIAAAGQRHSGLVLAEAGRFPRTAPNHGRVLADALAAVLSEHGAMLDGIESFVWWLERT